ncbi:MAG: hypothetical protein HF967_01250 [Methanosarcinales archaeon]|nr:hypothetical protein [Methanosarcinales archaeon]
MMDEISIKLEKIIGEIKAGGINKIGHYDEATTKQTIILRILDSLGWDIFNSNEVTPEYTVGVRKVDYSLRIEKNNKVFIEVKKVQLGLSGHQDQLLDYSFKEGIKLAVLTNGIAWWFYLPLHEGKWEERKFYTIDIFKQETKEIISKFIDFLFIENVRTMKAIENAEQVFKDYKKRNILNETLPKAWNELISNTDDELIKLIGEATEKICGYKPNDEIVKDFLLNNTSKLLIFDNELMPIKPIIKYDLDYHLKKIEDKNVLNRVNELRENILKISESIKEYYTKWHIIFKMNISFCKIYCQPKQFWVEVRLNEKEMKEIKEIMAENLYKDLDIRLHEDKTRTRIIIHDDTNLNLILNLAKKAYERL